jgi:2-dehydropantoate 2-reductase
LRVLVIGAGSVGLGLASCLLKSGQQVEIVARGEAGARLRTHGLVRTGLFGEFRARTGTFAVHPAIAQVPARPFDYLLVCVKSFDSEPVARELAGCPGLVSSASKIVLFQNGYGNFETFAAHFPREQLFVARVITGFCKTDRHRVEITVHAAPILVGSFLSGHSAAVAELCAAISRGDIPARVSGQIGRDLWAKILYNSMLNPLGALFGATYGELGASAHTRAIMDRIAAEAFAVMEAWGFATHWPAAGIYLEAFYRQMLPPTRQHVSSMLQSIRKGQRTEIDALNGALVSLGRERGVPVPVDETIVSLIRFMETHPPGKADPC